MFEKPLDRGINDVIKVDDTTEETIYHELDEYVVTNELIKHFQEFFRVYAESIDTPTDHTAVWISGFFGSGKSHFLKIISYLLDNDMKIHGKIPVDYFTNGKIEDKFIIADMKKASSVSTDVMLFNIDSKSPSREDNDAILKVFMQVFNEKRGYCGESDLFFLAKLEKKLDEENKYDSFKKEFEKINGSTWIEKRSDYYFITDDIKKALINIDFFSEKEVDNWIEKAEDYNSSITVENFAKEIKEYCEYNGNNHRVVFLVDEVGQYIGENGKLMLNLQSIVENLGTSCHGQAWVVVTSQQDINSIVKNVKNQDFSKIQGRFKLLNLSSANVDEVIKKRLLAKNETGQKTLESFYPQIEYDIKGIIDFDNDAEQKIYKDANEFSQIYPFIPYQFNLIQSVLTAIRQHSASGKHLAEGERSMLNFFQQAAVEYMDKEEDSIIPLYIFYDALERYIDHDHSIVITHAQDNDELNKFDVNLLKILFMIKYVKEIKPNKTNITTLMVNKIKMDRTELTEHVEKSLDKLYKQTLIQKNGENYTFLTNEEQDINRAVKLEIVEDGEITEKISKIIYDGKLKSKKYQYDKHHNFNFNKLIDDETSRKNYDMGIRIITPLYNFELNENDAVHKTLRELSKNNEAIFYLNNDNLIEEIKNMIQIEKYLIKNTNIPIEIKNLKNKELEEQNTRINIYLEDTIKSASIYINGNKYNIPEKNSTDRIDEVLDNLVKKTYNKLNYMDEISPEDSDIRDVLSTKHIEFGTNEKYINALNDMEDYFKRKKSTGETTTLKSVIDQYTRKPYGYNEKEIEWLISKLFVQKSIRLFCYSKEITSTNTQDTINYLTQSKYFDKITIEKRKETSRKDLKDLKEILKEVSGKINIVDEKIPNEIKDVLNKKLEELEEIKQEYIQRNYPEKDLLYESISLFKEILSINKEEDLIKEICENKDDILDDFNDLGPLVEFFNGTQKNIYVDALNIIQIYDENKNFLDNQDELIEIYNQILEITQQTKPYRQISKLPNLIANFNEIYDNILTKKKNPREQIINDNLNNLISLLDTIELKNKYETKITDDFNDLINKLKETKDFSRIPGFEEENEKLYDKYQKSIIATSNTIETKSEKINYENLHRKQEKPIKNIYINQLLTKTQIRIENENDLNEFIKSIKEELENELKINKKINIKR